jgi:hypothetical protein
MASILVEEEEDVCPQIDKVAYEGRLKEPNDWVKRLFAAPGTLIDSIVSAEPDIWVTGYGELL